MGALLLKPLSQAQADGDTIRAVIRGSAVSHGGKSNSMTAPRTASQARLICDAVSASGVAPSSISYLEAHGTGTKLGDPVEINALKKAFERLYAEEGADFSMPQRCWIGAVKTACGHLETAAGIAGLFKVIKAMEHDQLPANLNFSKQNPYVDLSESPFGLLTETRPWTTGHSIDGEVLPRRAGISSFGYGGVNSHVVLEESLQDQVNVGIPHGSQLFVFSGRTQNALLGSIEQFSAYIEARIQEPSKPGDLLEDCRELDMLCGCLVELLSLPVTDLDIHASLEDLGVDQFVMQGLISHINETYPEVANLIELSLELSLTEVAEQLRAGGKAHSVEVSQLSKLPSLTDAAYTLGHGREAMKERLAVVADSCMSCWIL